MNKLQELSDAIELSKLAKVDDDYHTYDNYFKKGDSIRRSSVRPIASKGYQEIDRSSDYWQPGAPTSSTGKAYERLTSYKKGQPGYNKASFNYENRNSHLMPGDRVSSDYAEKKKRAATVKTTKHVLGGVAGGASLVGLGVLAKKLMRK